MNYALMFPGQGSQAVGMLSGHSDPRVAETFAEASEGLGWDLADLIANGPVEALNQTDKTQPALLAAGVAVWRLWQATEPAPIALAGHSLGEYTALVAANSIDFVDALRVVELRGQLMQKAVPAGSGGMAAVIGLEDDAMEALCARCESGVLEPVNYNAPGQIVAAGDSAGLAWLEANGADAGARRVLRLPVSVPSHCSLMRNAAEHLAQALDQIEIRTPRIPVLHNLDASTRTDASQIRKALKEQLYRPVRWTSILAALQEQEVQALMECGPGNVLCGLARRAAKGVKTFALDSEDQMSKARAFIEQEPEQ